MKILNSNIDLEDFFHRLEGSSARILMIDYDGTLAPFRVERDRALPYPEAIEAIEAIQRDGGTRIVIVSGRSLDDLIPLIGLKELPEIWGCHGWERRLADGTRVDPDLPPRALKGLEEASAWADENGLGDRFEKKPASVAIHLRGLSEDEAISLSERANAAWEPIAGEHGLEIKGFDGGIEMRIPGRDKGSAIDAILKDARGDAVSSYLGDDLTDEDAFRALAGRGLSVLVNSKLRPTEADIWIEPPAGLVDFLKRWAKAAGGSDE